MPWSNSRPRSRRYDVGHNRERAEQMALLRQAGLGTCAETVCVMRSRLITPGMDLHLCHDTTGTVVLGLGHAVQPRGSSTTGASHAERAVVPLHRDALRLHVRRRAGAGGLPMGWGVSPFGSPLLTRGSRTCIPGS